MLGSTGGSEMLGAVFSFRGRLNRLQYFGGLCGLTAAVVVAVVIAVLSVGSLANIEQHPAVLLPALLIALLVLPIWIWVGLSLEARRIRDIGLNPVIVIPGVIVFGMLDQGLASAFPALSAGPNLHQTYIGAVVNLGYAACLFFWPGNSDVGPPVTSRLAWEPAQADASTMPSRVAAVLAATPPPASNSGAPVFGRRGV
jgi:uncharacterized membrane protein YhaH (DUF805 family)